MTTIAAWITPIPALSLWQPWATLMALGEKRIETRDWAPPRELWGRDFAIAAVKSTPAEGMQALLEEPFWTVLQDQPRSLPYGAVLAVVTLVGAWHTETVTRWDRFPAHERDFGDYTPGRWAWVTKNCRRLERPIPAKGKQGLWTWDPEKVSVA